MARTRYTGRWLLALWSGYALAHPHLLDSTPHDGSTLRAAPAHLELRFSEAARLTALWLEKEGEARQKLAPPAGEARKQIEVALPALTPGAYLVSWRALGSDGHVVPGQVRFTLAQ